MNSLSLEECMPQGMHRGREGQMKVVKRQLGTDKDGVRVGERCHVVGGGEKMQTL